MKVKKRVIISVIITIAILVLTRFVWFMFEPMPANITLDGKIENANITIILNRRNNNKFHKVRKADKLVTLNKETNVDFEIKNITYPKRLRIDFSNIKTKEPIIITKITFNNDKVKIKDFKDFSLTGGELKIEQNKLIIYPKEQDLQLLYNKKLTFSTIVRFEFELFLIILILSYLFAYKLTDYVANFSTLKHKSRIEIIFLTSFFVMIFLPMSWVNKEEISQKENRALAKWKPLVNQDLKFNYNFGKDVDNYFSDRFLMRNLLIKLYYTQFIINKNLRTNKVIKGKDNWLFHGVPSALNMYKKENLFSQENIELVAKTLQQYDNYCRKNNKKFYFYIAPSKSMVYSEFYSELIKQNKESKSLAEQLVEYLNKNTSVKVIYPKKALIENKDKSLLYWKTDTHWNEYGAYIGYQELMDKINKEDNLKELKINKFVETIEKQGDLDKHLPKIISIKEYDSYKVPVVPKEIYTCKITQDVTDVQNCNGKLNNKSLLMFRDSFTINLIPYLASTFKKSKFVWQPEVDFNLMQDADIVVLEMVEVNLPRLIGDKTEF